MKKKGFLLSIAYLLASAVIMANEFTIPDYEQIQSMGKEQYETLLQRFLSQDTTLTLTECQAVYYGSAFYNYLGSGANNKEIDKALEEGLKALASYLDQCLAKTPVDLKTIYYRYVVADRSKDKPTADKYYWMFIKLFETIWSTGDATSAKTAIHVVSVADEYAIIQIGLDMQLEQQSLLNSGCDVMDVVARDGTKISLFFDIQLVLALERQMFSNSKEPFHFTYKKSE